MTQYPRMYSSPGVFSSASVPVFMFTIWAWDRAASSWGLLPPHLRMGGALGDGFAFPPPGSAHPNAGKGDKDWSGSTTSQTPELGWKNGPGKEARGKRREWQLTPRMRPGEGQAS